MSGDASPKHTVDDLKTAVDDAEFHAGRARNFHNQGDARRARGHLSLALKAGALAAAIYAALAQGLG